MKLESRMCPIDFWVKCQGHCIDNWKKTRLGKKWFFIIPIVIKLYTKTPDVSRMFTIDFGVKRSRSQCIDNWKPFMLHNCSSFTTFIMKLLTQTPHELRICPIDFGVKRSKVKVTMHWLLKMIYVAWLLSFYTYHETSHTDSPWVEDVPYWFWGQKVRGQGRNAWITENGLCCIIAIPLQNESTICPYTGNFVVKSLESLNWLQQGFFILLWQPHSSFY